MCEKDFWDREFKEPARDIMNKLANLDDAVEGDAMVATTAASSTTRAASTTTLAIRDTMPPPTPHTTRTRDAITEDLAARVGSCESQGGSAMQWIPTWKVHCYS